MLESDPSGILAAQGRRALSYGFGSVLLGVSLQARGWSSTPGRALVDGHRRWHGTDVGQRRHVWRPRRSPAPVRAALVLASIPLAPTLPVAIALLLSRFAISQMDVPTRQAYVIALVDPEERTAAAAYTNTARDIGRPLGPALVGVFSAGRPGDAVLGGRWDQGWYDLGLWSWFRQVRLTPDESKVNAVTEG